jgi:hypothetical protein
MLAVVTTPDHHTLPDRGRRLSGKASVLALLRRPGDFETPAWKEERARAIGKSRGRRETRERGFSRDKKGRKFWAYASEERGSLALRERAAISLFLYSLFVPSVLNCNYARRRVGIDISHR